jgi:hypothetical protein
MAGSTAGKQPQSGRHVVLIADAIEFAPKKIGTLMNKLLKAPVLQGLALWLVAGALHASLGATLFEVSSQMHTEAAAKASSVPPDVKGQQSVILADGVMVLKSGNDEAVYDFKKRRLYVINLNTKTYLNESLYSTAGFRVLEFQSRESQRKAIASAAIAATLPSTLDSEHTLSLVMGGTAQISGRRENGKVIFSDGTREMAHWSEEGIDASPSDVAGFVQFLRYTEGGHPQILAELQSRHSVPSEISLSFNQPFGVTTKHLWVTGGKPVEWNADYLAGLKPESTAANSIDTMLDQGTRLNHDDALAAQRKNREVAAQAIADKRLLDVLLGTVEYRLITGETSPPLGSEMIEAINHDLPCKRFEVAIRAKTKAELDAAVKTLVELRANSTSGLDMLRLYEADARMHVGDNTALQLYGEVLQANPAIATAYKDLGDLFILKYDTQRAWRAWDIGRQLAPKLPEFGPVNDFEQRLVKDHPEYF